MAGDLPGPGSWSFRAPVSPGDEITAEAEVLEMRDAKPICTIRTAVVYQEPLNLTPS